MTVGPPSTKSWLLVRPCPSDDAIRRLADEEGTDRPRPGVARSHGSRPDRYWFLGRVAPAVAPVTPYVPDAVVRWWRIIQSTPKRSRSWANG